MNFPTQMRVRGLDKSGPGVIRMHLNYAVATERAVRISRVNSPPASEEEAAWRRLLLEHSPDGFVRSGRCSDC